MAGPPLRIASVGAGYFGRFHLEAWRRIEGADPAAVCDRAEAKAREAAAAFAIPAAYADAATMLDEIRPDLVDIAAPPAEHAPLVRAAAARGVRAIVCQKPFCRDLAEAREISAAAEAAGALLVVHENFRFQPWYREARRLIDAGALGEVYQAAFRLRPGDGRGAGAYADRQPYFRTMERFLVHETAIHFIDTFRYLFGEAKAVYASLHRLNPAIAGEDAGHIILEHAGGTRSLFDGNRLVDHAARNRRLTLGEMLIEGSEAVLRLDGNGGLWLRRAGSSDETAHPFAWSDRGFGGDCVFLFQQHVADALRLGRPCENTAADYLRNLEIEDAAYRSAETGCRIAL
ncbi:MAG: Gfo/Idh/MocA family oxidoreductase [Candidatus Odyssella sp.]|nr:Gfo/Idh/MocA family oxidoreductase [Candidatus Odyssella sp.]